MTATTTDPRTTTTADADGPFQSWGGPIEVTYDALYAWLDAKQELAREAINEAVEVQPRPQVVTPASRGYRAPTPRHGLPGILAAAAAVLVPGVLFIHSLSAAIA